MNSSFEIRAAMDCGWNIFCREGKSEDAEKISVNHDYLDHLHKAGLNRIIVFWANSRGFDNAWAEAVPYAHSVGLKLVRAISAFCGGAQDAPGVPAHLLTESAKGPGTALCPHDPETQQWFAGMMARLLEPDVDGLDIEPARHTSCRCVCPQCSAMNPYEWDVYVTNSCAEHILRIKPNAEIFMHVYTKYLIEPGDAMKDAYRQLNHRIHHIFGWEADDEQTMRHWLDLDPRFGHFAKLGRVLLFPGGDPPTTPAFARVARVFRWCRLAAEKGKKGYLFDYRMFGGVEWKQESDAGCPNSPVTRQAKKLPASIAVMGAAMRDPYLDETGQSRLLERMRNDTDWDLDDPACFWIGERKR